MVKGTTSMGKFTRKHVHMRCRRCGKNSFHKRHHTCASCGFPKVAKNGVWGDPIGATKKDGEKFLAEIVRNLAKECQS